MLGVMKFIACIAVLMTKNEESFLVETNAFANNNTRS